MLLQMALFHSVLWLSNIPVCVCVCTTSSLSTHLLMVTKVVSYILAFVNSAAMNIKVHVSF